MTAVLTEIQAHLAIIRINRPDKLNALTPRVLEDLTGAVGECGASEDVRAIAISGCGTRAFAAGCDVALFDGLDEEGIVDFMEKGRRAVDGIQSSAKPIIAMISGFALGGGFELALACDLIIAEETASFGFPEVKLGLIPGFGGTHLLPRMVGPHRARDIIYSGRIIDAGHAKEWGIVNRVVQAGKLADGAAKICGEISSRDPMAVAAAKRSIAAGMSGSREEALKMEKEEFLRCFSNPQSKRRITAFLKSKRAQ